MSHNQKRSPLEQMAIDAYLAECKQFSQFPTSYTPREVAGMSLRKVWASEFRAAVLLYDPRRIELATYLVRSRDRLGDLYHWENLERGEPDAWEWSGAPIDPTEWTSLVKKNGDKPW